MTAGHVILAGLAVLLAGCALWCACSAEVRRGLRASVPDPDVLLPYTVRPGLPRVPRVPVDESALRETAVLVIAEATAACRRDAEIQANARLMDTYAAAYPMQRRPLVERAEINPQGDINDC